VVPPPMGCIVGCTEGIVGAPTGIAVGAACTKHASPGSQLDLGRTSCNGYWVPTIDPMTMKGLYAPSHPSVLSSVTVTFLLKSLDPVQVTTYVSGCLDVSAQLLYTSVASAR